MQNLSIYQLILGILSLLFLTNGFVKFIRKEKNQSFFKFITTVFIWGVILFIALFPQFTHDFSRFLGMGENLNTLIFIGFVVIFMIIYKLLHIIEKLERNISEIIRKEALSKLNKQIKKNENNLH